MQLLSDDMSCTEVLDRLEAFVDDDLDPAEAEAIACHLRSCTPCAAELDVALAVQGELRSWPELDAGQRVLTAIAEATHESRSPTSWLRPLTALAAGLLLAAAVMIVSDRRQAARRAEQVIADETIQQVELALAVLGAATGRIHADVKEQLDHKVIERTLHLCLQRTSHERGEP